MRINYTLLEAKLQKLKKLKTSKPRSQTGLEEWYNVELTYSSNAIEGNTLSRIETAEVIEKGVNANIPGKPFKDLLEARNHAKALNYIKSLARQLKGHQFITEKEILNIHKIILNGIDDKWAGVYRQSEVFVRGSNSTFPQPEIVPSSMEDFFDWLKTTQNQNPVKTASDAHYKFVSIHPFVDGNGRCARLLMNLVLTIHGYPMAVIKNEDRSKYLASLERVQTKNDLSDFCQIIYEAVENSLDSYIKFYEGKNPLKKKIEPEELIRIGELARKTGETIHTLHFWIKEGLIKGKDKTKGGYQLFDKETIERIKEIRDLQQNQRLTLSEIKQRLT